MATKTRNIEAIECLVIDDVIDSTYLTLSECYSVAGGFPFTVRAAGSPPSNSVNLKFLVPTGEVVTIHSFGQDGESFSYKGAYQLRANFRRWQLVRAT